MNIDHELETLVKRFLPKSIILGVFALSAACATPSAQHSAQAVDHSGNALGHSVAAVGTGAALVSAAPLTAAGTVLTVSGAGLADAAYGPDGTYIIPLPAPDGPPVLK
ncbi:hypothetical protein SAMN04488005_0015 [Yoonia tamlensis]|uniref:Uncharacterized protein n=1 Tax=Yoonia tamlensis TaxID=390270 RepID=A0A1I6FN64_9RHOB|nr:hypothetical protein SAMN04488005_0015 [Yoonia tamlensis]